MSYSVICKLTIVHDSIKDLNDLARINTAQICKDVTVLNLQTMID